MDTAQSAQEIILAVPQEDFECVPKNRSEEIKTLTEAAMMVALKGDIQGAVNVIRGSLIAMYSNGKRDAQKAGSAFEDFLNN